MPLRPTKRALAWLFGPALGVYAFGAALVVAGLDEPTWLALMIAVQCVVVVAAGMVSRLLRRPAPAALSEIQLAARSALAAPVNYQVIYPALGSIQSIVAPAIVIPSDAPPAQAIAVICAVVPLLLAVRYALGGPHVAITADGIVLQNLWRWTIPWESLGRVELGRAKTGTVLHITTLGPHFDRFRRFEMGTGVNLVYLMDMIGYYQTNPGRRAFIGAPGEQERVYPELLRHRLAPGTFHSGA
jgi:hypothetical protein